MEPPGLDGLECPLRSHRVQDDATHRRGGRIRSVGLVVYHVEKLRRPKAAQAWRFAYECANGALHAATLHRKSSTMSIDSMAREKGGEKQCCAWRWVVLLARGRVGQRVKQHSLRELLALPRCGRRRVPPHESEERLQPHK